MWIHFIFEQSAEVVVSTHSKNADSRSQAIVERFLSICNSIKFIRALLFNPSTVWIRKLWGADYEKFELISFYF